MLYFVQKNSCQQRKNNSHTETFDPVVSINLHFSTYNDKHSKFGLKKYTTNTIRMNDE